MNNTGLSVGHYPAALLHGIALPPLQWLEFSMVGDSL